MDGWWMDAWRAEEGRDAQTDGRTESKRVREIRREGGMNIDAGWMKGRQEVGRSGGKEGGR